MSRLAVILCALLAYLASFALPMLPASQAQAHGLMIGMDMPMPHQSMSATAQGCDNHQNHKACQQSRAAAHAMASDTPHPKTMDSGTLCALTCATAHAPALLISVSVPAPSVTPQAVQTAPMTAPRTAHHHPDPRPPKAVTSDL